MTKKTSVNNSEAKFINVSFWSGQETVPHEINAASLSEIVGTLSNKSCDPRFAIKITGKVQVLVI